MNKKRSIIIPTLLVAIAIPLTLFSVLQQQDNRSKASTNMTTNAGRPFADDSAWNQPIGTDVQLDPKSAEMVQTLAAGEHIADLYEFGTPIYFADASTPKHNISCTENWGTCGISTEPVPIPDDAKQAPGSDGQMVIVDLSARKSYEFWIYKDDKATTNWGGILPLDGDGRGSPENSAIGAGTSRLAGIIRTYEIEQGNIEHALVFSSKYCAVDEIRFPAVKTDGKYSGAGAIPEGARVQLDPTLNVDSMSMTKGEKAVAKALQKYGAYVIDCGGAGMAFQFEHPMSKPDPYPAAGLTSDYIEMGGIPWDKMRVLKEWNSYTPVAGGGTQPTTGAPSNPAPTLITPTIYCVGGNGQPPCAPIDTTTTPGAGGGTPGSGTPGVTGGVNPSGGASTPYPSNVEPCASDSSASVQTNKKGKKKYKRNRGGFIERFIKFIIWLIEFILKGGNVPIPTDPGSPCPEPTSEVTPTTEPTITTEPSPDASESAAVGSTNSPAQVLNLTNWKLQLPIGAAESPTEIKQPQLASYKNDQYFTVSTGGGVRFRAPVNGVTTSGSDYPRSELREMTNNGSTQASWSTASGTHTMILDEAITAVPTTKKQIIAGQILAGTNNVIQIRLNYPKLFIALGSAYGGGAGPTLDANYTLGKRFTIKIEVTGTKTNVYYNGSQTPVYTFSQSYSNAYFKAGAYTQSNCTTETANCNANNYGEVVLYKAEVTHK